MAKSVDDMIAAIQAAINKNKNKGVSTPSVSPLNPSSGQYGSNYDPSSFSNGNIQNFFNQAGGDDTRNAGIARLFQQLQTGNFGDALTGMLNNESWSSEFWSLFYEAALQQAMTQDQRVYDAWRTQDQRAYDYSLLKDQRSYESPAAQLARLMGSGISRDKAIEILSNSPISPVNGSPVTGSAGSPGSTSGTPGDQNLAKVGMVMNGLQTIAGLVSTGLSIPQALYQNDLLKNQATLSQFGMQGLTSADAVFNSLGSAVSSGAIDQETFDSLTNANDALKYILDHRDTNSFKHLFANGDFDRVYGSKFGREAFAGLWHDVADTKSYGSQLESYLRNQDLQNELTSLSTKKAQRDFYMDYQKQLRDLIQQDEQIGILWNQYQSGSIKVLIDGEQLEQAKTATSISKLSQTSAERASYREGVEFNAYKNFVENGEPVEPGANATGQDMIDYLTWGNYFNHLQRQLVLSSTKGSKRTWSNDGKLHIDSSFRDENISFLRRNQRVAIQAAFLNDIISNNRIDMYQGDGSGLFKFFDVLKTSGTLDVISTATDVTSDVALPLVLKP